MERSFADSNQLFGHRYTRFRSLVRAACQCLLAGATQNMKKIARALTKKPRPMWDEAFSRRYASDEIPGQIPNSPPQRKTPPINGGVRQQPEEADPDGAGQSAS